jgi:hypothetical protein
MNKNSFFVIVITTILIAGHCQLSSQNFTSSKLPIVIINTKYDANTGKYEEILDVERIIADMKIIKRPGGSRNYLSDQNNTEYLNYNGKINIEIRGSTSQWLEKKPYGFSTKKSDGTTNNNVNLLDMPADNDWVLNALAYDQSLIRDFICYNLYNQMGRYTTRTQYCELVLNGEYRGLYLLQEKLKQGSGRINVTKIKSADIAPPTVTGGYIIKADKFDAYDEICWTMDSYTPSNNYVEYICVLPKYDEVNVTQLNYIKNIFFEIEKQAKYKNAENTGIPSVIDVPSFIDYILISEYTANVDAYQYSTYFHKERGGDLRAGPIWDNNLTLGNDLFQLGYDRSKTYTWQFDNNDNEGSYFWKDLFNTPKFKCYLTKRWKELSQTGKPLSYSNLKNLIDSAKILISEAAVNEQLRWNTIPYFKEDINKIKAFADARSSWINGQFGSTSLCDNVIVPELIIDKISYDPKPDSQYPSSNALEFISITNISDSDAELTGIDFAAYGFSYSFPPNKKLQAHNSLYLAGDTSIFRKKYNVNAFGQFNQNLSNTNQKLALFDAWGNQIDIVEYKNSAPWPNANQNGKYIFLKDKNADNNKGENWILAEDSKLVKTIDADDFCFDIYPNPTNGIINIAGNLNYTKIEILNLLGQKTNFRYIGNKQIELEAKHKGLYLINFYQKNKVKTSKIILL